MSQTGSSQSQTVYIQLNQITELRRRDVFLKDVGEVTCSKREIRLIKMYDVSFYSVLREKIGGA